MNLNGPKNITFFFHLNTMSLSFLVMSLQWTVFKITYLLRNRSNLVNQFLFHSNSCIWEIHTLTYKRNKYNLCSRHKLSMIFVDFRKSYLTCNILLRWSHSCYGNILVNRYYKCWFGSWPGNWSWHTDNGYAHVSKCEYSGITAVMGSLIMTSVKIS